MGLIDHANGESFQLTFECKLYVANIRQITLLNEHTALFLQLTDRCIDNSLVRFHFAAKAVPFVYAEAAFFEPQ